MSNVVFFEYRKVIENVLDNEFIWEQFNEKESIQLA